MFTGPLAERVECSPMAREIRVRSSAESYQKYSRMVLDISLLNAQHYQVCIKGKVEQSISALPYSCYCCILTTISNSWCADCKLLSEHHSVCLGVDLYGRYWFKPEFWAKKFGVDLHSAIHSLYIYLTSSPQQNVTQGQFLSRD